MKIFGWKIIFQKALANDVFGEKHLLQIYRSNTNRTIEIEILGYSIVFAAPSEYID